MQRRAFRTFQSISPREIIEIVYPKKQSRNFKRETGTNLGNRTHTSDASGSRIQQDLIIIIRISGSAEISIRLHIVPFRNPCALRFEIKRAQTPPLLSSERARVAIRVLLSLISIEIPPERYFFFLHFFFVALLHN